MKIVQAWNDFFFKPISPATIGVFRIAFGSVIFFALLGKFPYRDLLYGAEAVVSYESVSFYFPGHPFFYFRWLPQQEPWLGIYFCGILAATLSLIVGFQTRLSSILVFLGLLTLDNRNPFIANNGDNFMRISAFWLMFTQAGAAYSVDRWLKRKKGLASSELQAVAPWGQRLLQLQLAYLYFEATLTKNGAAWLDGTALYYALNYPEIKRFDFSFLFTNLWSIKALTWGTMLAELSAFSLIWFRKTRYFVLAAAVALHMGINILMQFPIFQYVMITSLITFIYPEDIEEFFKCLKERWNAKRN